MYSAKIQEHQGTFEKPYPQTRMMSVLEIRMTRPHTIDIDLAEIMNDIERDI